VKCLCRLGDKVPESVDEAVDLLFRAFGCEMGMKFLEMSVEEFVVTYHFTIGLYIRNKFGLWGKDSKIMEELNALMADETSKVIMVKLWYRFKDECPKKMIKDKGELEKFLRRLARKEMLVPSIG